MEDYPRNLADLEARFSTEQACRDYLYQLRWPDGFGCPQCGESKAWPVGRGLFECGACRHQTSVMAGTIFQDTHKPLCTWFRVIWWVATQKDGASAMGLHRTLGMSYKTAWAWLHKLRRAMVRPGRDRLSGRIEVDETYVGGSEQGVRGRKTETKSLVVIAAQEDGKGVGRVRMRRVHDASTDSLHPFILDCIEPGSVVHTDGWQGYSGLKGKGYTHEVSVLAGKKGAASTIMPRVHIIAALLKRWLLSTHQGAVSAEHLNSYLDEYTFRFNRRKSRSCGKLFYRLVQQSLMVPPAPFKELIANHKI